MWHEANSSYTFTWPIAECHGASPWHWCRQETQRLMGDDRGIATIGGNRARYARTLSPSSPRRTPNDPEVRFAYWRVERPGHDALL
jgi:hypothetical protein